MGNYPRMGTIGLQPNVNFGLTYGGDCFVGKTRPPSLTKNVRDASSQKTLLARNNKEMGAALRQNPLFDQFAHLPYRRDGS